MNAINKVNVGGFEYLLGANNKVKRKIILLTEYDFYDEAGAYHKGVHFKLDEPLKYKTWYLIKYYNDDLYGFGTIFTYFDDGIFPEGLDGIFFDQTNNEYNYCYFGYVNSNIPQLNNAIQVSIDGLEYNDMVDYDYIEIYEFPITLEVEEE